MTQATCAEMHTDHRHWEDELAMWKQDIACWRAEHRERLAEIKQATAAHESALEEHANALRVHDEEIVQHEHLLAELLKLGRPDDGEVEGALEEMHSEERARQAGHREAHERIKRHHDTAMARLSVLVAALQAPE